MDNSLLQEFVSSLLFVIVDLTGIYFDIFYNIKCSWYKINIIRQNVILWVKTLNMFIS